MPWSTRGWALPRGEGRWTEQRCHIHAPAADYLPLEQARADVVEGARLLGAQDGPWRGCQGERADELCVRVEDQLGIGCGECGGECGARGVQVDGRL